GTTAAGLRAGIPALILWLWLDQPVWAAGVERLGVGAARQLSATTQGSLVADLATILSPEYASRAREVAGQISTSPESLARAADLLEDVARLGSQASSP
ncbi:glycosyltransferase, partial [Mycobacterium sp. 852002-51057_SCH5723018]|uniref:glycosyltransferase n=1 Tax=Mycobacterium sp. 852002-51057_SCH5723018 TaxID=1834094 RepID=UPI000B1EC27F